jgi:hypothetical protein
MKKTDRTSRAFRHWVRRWLRTSKPTEWITSASQFIAVLSALIAGIIWISNGVFDQKRSELEARRSELSMQNSKLEAAQKELITKRNAIDVQIIEREKTIKEKDELIALIRKQYRGTAEMFVEQSNMLKSYTENARALAFLTAYNRSHLVNSEDRSVSLRCDVASDQALNITSVTIVGQEDRPVQSKDKYQLLAAAMTGRLLGELRVRNVQLDARDLRAFSTLKNLRTLELTNCGITNELLSALTLDRSTINVILKKNPVSELPRDAKRLEPVGGPTIRAVSTRPQT